MMFLEAISLKRGDSFLLSGQAFAPDGSPATLTGVDIQAQVRCPGRVDPVDTLVCTAVDADRGTYSISASEDGLTGAWPVGLLGMDIQFTWTNGGRTVRRSTQTMFIDIIEDVTQ